MKNLKQIAVGLAFVSALAVIPASKSYAWNDSSQQKQANGETIKCDIYMGNGRNFKIQTASWLYDIKDTYSSFTNSFSSYLSGVSVSLTLSEDGPSVSVSQNGTTGPSASMTSKSNYAGISMDGSIDGVNYVYLKGKSSGTVQHYSQSYSHSEDCFK